MASRTGEAEMSNRKVDDFRHTCALCMEPYKNRSPKLLPCFHSFCLACLTTLAEKTTQQGNAVSAESVENEKGKIQTSEQSEKVADENQKKESSSDGLEQKMAEENGGGDGGGGGVEESKMTETKTESETASNDSKAVGEVGNMFLCPTCRAPVTVPRGGVASLQANFYVESNGEVQSPSPPPQCDMCEEGEAQDASFTCNKCCQLMCRTCRRLHDKCTNPSEHHVQALNIHEPPVRTAERKMCAAHAEQELCFHCQKCDVSICLHCKLTSHEGHVTEDMATAALRAKQELAGIVIKAKKQLQMSEDCVGRLQRDELEVKRQKQEVTQQINTEYNAILAWASRARDEALEVLGAKEKSFMGNISTEMTSARDTVETLSTLTLRASRETRSGPDTLLLKNELQAALLSDEVFEERKKVAVRDEHLVFFTCRRDQKAVTLDSVRAFVGRVAEVGVQKLEAEESQLTSVCFEATSCVWKSYSTPVVFNKVACNDGGCYDKSSGIFITPKAGTYAFSFKMTRCSGYRYNMKKSCELKIEGLPVGFTELPTVSDSISYLHGHVQLMLDKGKRVWIQTNDELQDDCTFWGALLI